MKKISLSMLLIFFALTLFSQCSSDDDNDSKKKKAKSVGINEISAKESRLGSNKVFLGQEFDFKITITSQITVENVPLNIYFLKKDKFPNIDALIEEIRKNDDKNGGSLPDGKTVIGDQNETDPNAIKNDPDIKNMIAADPIMLSTLQEGTHTYELTATIPTREGIESSSDWLLVAVIDQENIVEEIGDTECEAGSVDDNGKSDGKFEKIFIPVTVSSEKMNIPDIGIEWVNNGNNGLPLATDVIVLPADENVIKDDNGNPIFNDPIINDSNVYINGNINVFALNDTIQNIPVTFKLYKPDGTLITQLDVWDSEIKGFAESYVIDELSKNKKNKVIPFSLAIPDGNVRTQIINAGQSFVLKVEAVTPKGVVESDQSLDEAHRNNFLTCSITIVKDTSKGSKCECRALNSDDNRNPGLTKSKNYDIILGNNNFGVTLANEGKLDVNANDGAMVTLTGNADITVMNKALKIIAAEAVAQFAPQSPPDTHAHFKLQFIGINLYYWEAKAEWEWEKKWEVHKEKAYPPTVVMVGPVPINLQAGIQGSLGFKISFSLDSEQPSGEDESKSIFNAEGQNQLNDAYKKLKKENQDRQERWAKAKQEESRRKAMSSQDAKNEKRKDNKTDKDDDSEKDDERPDVEYPGSTSPGSGGLVANVGPYVNAGAFASASLGIPGFFEAGIKGNLNIVNIEFMAKGLVKCALENYLPENWEAMNAIVKGSGNTATVAALSDVRKKVWDSSIPANLKYTDPSSGINYVILSNDNGDPVYADSYSYFAQGSPILVYEPISGDENTAGSALYNLKAKNYSEYLNYVALKNGSMAENDNNRLTIRKLQLGDINALVFFPKVNFSIELSLAGPNGSVGPYATLYYPKFCEVRPCIKISFFGRTWRKCFSIYYPCGLGSTSWYYPLASFTSWEKNYTLLTFSMPYKDSWKLRIPLDSAALNIINNYRFKVVSPATVEPERRLALFGVDLSGDKLVNTNVPQNVKDVFK